VESYSKLSNHASISSSWESLHKRLCSWLSNSSKVVHKIWSTQDSKEWDNEESTYPMTKKNDYHRAWHKHFNSYQLWSFQCQSKW
jgi:hypothetical protein